MKRWQILSILMTIILCFFFGKAFLNMSETRKNNLQKMGTWTLESLMPEEKIPLPQKPEEAIGIMNTAFAQKDPTLCKKIELRRL